MEQRLQKYKSKLQTIYDPRTAFGNPELLEILSKTQEIEEKIINDEICDECDGDGVVNHICSCDLCDEWEETCPECDGDGYITPED